MEKYEAFFKIIYLQNGKKTKTKKIYKKNIEK